MKNRNGKQASPCMSTKTMYTCKTSIEIARASWACLGLLMLVLVWYHQIRTTGTITHSWVSMLKGGGSYISFHLLLYEPIESM